jgi:hypothetical protein
MAKSYFHVTLDQRCQIQTLQSTGKSQNRRLRRSWDRHFKSEVHQG